MLRLPPILFAGRIMSLLPCSSTERGRERRTLPPRRRPRRLYSGDQICRLPGLRWARATSSRGVHPRYAALDLLRAGERSELEVVDPRLSGLQLYELAPRTRVQPAGGAVRARLDAHGVDALAEHAPAEVVRQLVVPEKGVQADAQLAVDDCDRHGPVFLRYQVVLEDLFDESASWRSERSVALDWVVPARHDAVRGNQELGPVVNDREASGDVVEVHVRGAVGAHVLDLVVDCEPRLADARLDAPAEEQLLAEDRRLQHLALGPEQALVPFPALAVAGQSGRAVRDPAVQTKSLRLFRRVVVPLCPVLGHGQR